MCIQKFGQEEEQRNGQKLMVDGVWGHGATAIC